MRTQRQADRRLKISSKWMAWAGFTAAFLIGCLSSLALLSSTAGFISNDDYYHSRIASEIIEQGTLRVAFPWLPLTILSPEKFVDHHLLYHVFLAPFSYWGGVTGAKMAQALIVGGIFAAFWALLRRLEIRPSWLWLIALLGVSAPFLYRMIMVRAQGAAVLLLLLALYTFFSNRPRWLILIAFAFTWLYNGFILLPIFAGLYLVSAWLADRRFVWQPLIYTLIGTAAGLIFNPYFPQNIVFILDHLGEKIDIASNIRVGSEWYPYTTQALLGNSLGALLAMVGGMIAPSLRKTGRDRTETMLLLTAILTLYMTFESRRFIEYAPIFALLFCAAALGRNTIRWDQVLPSFAARLRFKWVLPLLLILPVLALVWNTVHTVQQDIQDAPDSDYMEGAARWLQANTPPNALIFQTDWDDFTYLFYHNTHNTYLVGLDPTYLQVADPTLWNLWVPITQGMVERPSVLIRESFSAAYVISDVNHEAFASSAENDPNMHLVYRDSYSLIWQVTELQPEN